MKKTNGFTIIELIVTIVILALIATIATVGFSNVQKQARDSRRSSNASTVAEALEKYFTRNGEYPSVASMTNSNGTSVQNLLGLSNGGSLLAPSASQGTTNSWKTGAASYSNQLTYSGNTDNSSSCTTGNTASDACIDFKIQYYNEQDGTTTTITSRHTSSTIASTTLDAPTLPPTPSVGYTSPNIVASWTTASCASGSPQYAYQSRTNDGTWSAWSSWQTGTSTTTPSSEGTKFGYQVKARCVSGSVYSGDSATSSEATYIAGITTVPGVPAPYVTGPLLPTVVSSSICMDANGAGGAGTVIQIYGCNGTAAQDWAFNSNDHTLRPTYNMALCINYNGKGAQLTLASCNGTTTQQWTRSDDGTFHSVVSGYCIDDSNWGTANGNSIGAWDCTGATAQTWNMADSQNAWTWPAVTCSSTTSPQYQVNYQQTNIADSGWSNIGTSTRVVRTTVNQGYTYNTQVQARCVSPYTSGSWSATGQANMQKAILQPSNAYNYAFGENAANRANITWWWTFNMGCGAGGNLYYQEDDWLSGPGNPVYWTAPRTPNGPGYVGWWTADSTGGAPYTVYGPNPTLKNTSTYYSSVGTPAPSGSVTTQTRVQGYCNNPTTGRSSPWSPWSTSGAAYI